MGERKYTIDIVKDEFEKSNYKLLSESYNGYVIHLDYMCNNGHLSSITFKNFLKGKRCKKCFVNRLADIKRLEYSEVNKVFEENRCKLLSTEYINSHSHLEYICVCGNISKITFTHFKNGKRCMKCAIQKRSKNNLHSYEYVENTFKQNGCRLLSKTYECGDILLDYICNCGRISKITFYSFLRGNRCRECCVERNSGIKHYKWDKTKTDEERRIGRNNSYYQVWRRKIFKRDNHMCIMCGSKHRINAHHLNGYKNNVEDRYKLDNGVTLCLKCHRTDKYSFHKIYGMIGNTKEQFEEWKDNILLLKGLSDNLWL